MLSGDILFLSIRELGAHLRKKSFSPVELAESYLDRSARLAPNFNAYALITREIALQQAHQAEHELTHGHDRGPLHGIPYAAKDLVAVKGIPTTWGAKPFENQVFDENATVIERLNAAGAVMLGKAAMIELAGGLGYSDGKASLTGACRNPWNTDYWTCGSSSGSGAIVAAGLAPWALGSDTRGSIICPSAWCGISGMRPSFGRVSRYGAMAIAWSMDKLGPMARTADDCGLVLSVIAGHDPKDHDSLFANEPFRYPAANPASHKPLRIGRLTNIWNHPEPEVEAAVTAAIQSLQQHGATVADTEFPEGPYEQAAELTILIEAASSFQDLIHSGRCSLLEDPLGQINGYASEQFSAVDYLQTQRVRAILQRRVDALFESFDLLVAAGQSGPAELLAPPPSNTPPHEDQPEPMESRAPDGVSSLCGLPAITVPCGLNAKHLPLGVQFIGRAGADSTVIAAAHRFQALTKWHLARPPVQ